MSSTIHGLAAVTPLAPRAPQRTRVRIPLRFADGQEHVAMVRGDPASWDVPLVRMHSECLTGDVFGSTRCDCGPQLREAVEGVGRGGGGRDERPEGGGG